MIWNTVIDSVIVWNYYRISDYFFLVDSGSAAPMAPSTKLFFWNGVKRAFSCLYSNCRRGCHICKCMQITPALPGSGRIPAQIVLHAAVGAMPTCCDSGIWLALPCWNSAHWNFSFISAVVTCETGVPLIAAKPFFSSLAHLKHPGAGFCCIKAQPGQFQGSQAVIQSDKHMWQTLFWPTQGGFRAVTVGTEL